MERPTLPSFEVHHATWQLEKAKVVVQDAASVLRYRCKVDGNIADNMRDYWMHNNCEAETNDK